MKRLTIATAAIALTAGTASAATTVADVDMNGDAFASFDEVKAAFPDFPLERFIEVDVNDDNRLSTGEMQNLDTQTVFGLYEMVPMEERDLIVLDANGDGFINEDEIRRAFPEFTTVDFREIDTNDDNRLSYQEYYADGASEVIGRYRAEGIRGIAQIDTDGDSFATFGEMTAAFPGVTEREFEVIDLNDDNRVSATELYELDAQEIVSRYES